MILPSILRSPALFLVKVASVPPKSKPVNCGESPVPTPIEVLKVAPDSATGSVVPSPTIISPSANTAIAVIAPVPLPNNIPPSVNVEAPVPPY